MYAAKKVRFITEKAWHHHFVKNMFIEERAALIGGAWYGREMKKGTDPNRRLVGD